MNVQVFIFVFVGMEYSNNSSTKIQKFWFQNYADA